MSTFFQNRTVKHFSSISIANNFDVEIFIGSSGSSFGTDIEIHTNNNSINAIKTKVNSFGKLFIHMEDAVLNSSRALISIHTTNLNSLFVRDTVHASVMNVCGKSFNFEGIDHSVTKLVGHVDHLHITTLGDAILSAIELDAKNVTISCDHDSIVNISVDESITGTSYGNSNIKYKGNPYVQISDARHSNLANSKPTMV